MSDNEKPPTSPSELAQLTEAIKAQTDEIAAARREVTGTKQATGRMADALMGVHSVTSRTARRIDSIKETGERIETKVGVLGEKMAALDANVSHAEADAAAAAEGAKDASKAIAGLTDEIEEITEKITLPTKEELRAEDHARVALSWAGSIWKHRAVIVAVVSTVAAAIGWGWHALRALLHAH